MKLDIRLMFQTWVNVLTKPGQEVFEAERLKPSATLTTALVWIVLAGAIATLLELLRVQFYPSPLWSTWPIPSPTSPEFRAAMEAIPVRSQTQILAGLVTTPFLFIISVGIQHLIASSWGSDRIRLEPSGEIRKGNFGRYAFLIATFEAPLAIIISLLSFVSFLIFLTILILGIYQLVLSYFAARAEYGLSRGRAIVVGLVGPLLVGGGIGLLGGVFINIGLFS